jgi:putative heme-binding domain-containing protein
MRCLVWLLTALALGSWERFGGGGAAGQAAAQEAQWIWSPAQTGEIPAGTCYFRKTFKSGQPEHAEIQISADEAFELYVNGRKVGEGNNWRVMQTFDVTKYLVGGRNMVAVKVTNTAPPSAGVVARVLVKENGGTFVAHISDGSWKSSLKEATHWMKPSLDDGQWVPAAVLGPLGIAKPWLDEVQMAGGGGASRFKTTREFRVETAVPAEQTGSLLTMAFNEFGEIVASVEGGGLMLIRDRDNDGVLDKPTLLTDVVKNCQGILPLNGQLFVVGAGSEGPGFYCLSDEDNDGRPETARLLLKFTGEASEHGAHAPVLGPDGLIYLVLGNHTRQEAEADSNSPYSGAIEGDMLPRYEDPRGHAAGVKAPGGTVIRTDTSGSFVETFAGGLRNSYDIAFNRRGDLFAYDSDMEWDLGLPWYRPTRVSYLPSGAECGWRSGWAVWPEYFYDSLPAVVETGRGSPTGIVFYHHVMYPRRYHDALFVGDWAGGRILAVRMRADGGGYSAETETLVEGRPLNVTDLTVGPDGALYFCTGGRGTEGGIYRVVWNGRVPPAMTDLGRGIEVAIRQPQLDSAWARQKCAMAKHQLGDEWDQQIASIAANGSNKPEDRLRALDLMQLLGPFPESRLLVELSRDTNELVRAKAAYLMGIHPDELTRGALVRLLGDSDAAVQRQACESLARAGHAAKFKDLEPLLDSSNRFVAYQAALAAKHIPVEELREGALKTESHRAFVQGSLAWLSLSPDRATAEAIIRRGQQHMQGFVADPEFLDLLRLTELCLIRGQLKGDDVPSLRMKLADEYPTKDARMNRELVRLLAYLGEHGAADRMLEQLRADLPQEEKLHLGLYARFFDRWSSAQKFELLSFYEHARSMSGGHSFAGYLDNVSRDFAANLNESERAMVLEDAIKWPSFALSVLARLPAQPGETTLDQVRQLDRRLAGLETNEAIRKLGIGIIAVLGRSGDEKSMAYLREVYERDPARRGYISMALAQHPGGENWPLLVQSLSIVEGAFANEVLTKLATVDRAPDKPEPVRQVIVCGLKLGDNGGQHAVTLLEKWTNQRLTMREEKPTDALVAWQHWFRNTYPHEPEPAPPSDSPENLWTQEELLSFLSGPEAAKGSIERGASVFVKAECSRCHRFGDRGEAIGPDLTTVSQRFQKREILEAILHPSQVISDQYASRTLTLADGRSVTGMVAPQQDGSFVVLQSDGNKVNVTKEEIAEVEPSRKSSMPEGLLNPLTLEEIADLFAYLSQPPRDSITSRRGLQVRQ